MGVVPLDTTPPDFALRAAFLLQQPPRDFVTRQVFKKIVCITKTGMNHWDLLAVRDGAGCTVGIFSAGEQWERATGMFRKYLAFMGNVDADCGPDKWKQPPQKGIFSFICEIISYYNYSNQHNLD